MNFWADQLRILRPAAPSKLFTGLDIHIPPWNGNGPRLRRGPLWYGSPVDRETVEGLRSRKISVSRVSRRTKVRNPSYGIWAWSGKCTLVFEGCWAPKSTYGKEGGTPTLPTILARQDPCDPCPLPRAGKTRGHPHYKQHVFMDCVFAPLKLRPRFPLLD